MYVDTRLRSSFAQASACCTGGLHARLGPDAHLREAEDSLQLAPRPLEHEMTLQLQVGHVPVDILHFAPTWDLWTEAARVSRCNVKDSLPEA